jgi:Domain of unknown function (DUF6908)
MDDTTFTTPPNAPSAPHGAEMQKLNDRATRIFISLVDGLRVGDAKKVDNARGAFMAVSVDFLVGEEVQTASGPSWALYAVAHHYFANGDLIPEPDVEFYVIDDPAQPGAKAIYPIAIDHGPLGYHRYAQLEGAGHISCVLPRGQADLARFCDVWMKNIAAQQRLEVR